MRGVGKVLENSFLYTFSSLLTKAIGFLLLPVYTLYLTPDDYGITNLINSFTSVAAFIVAFSLYASIVRFYTDFKNDRKKLKRFYGTIITFVSLSGIIFVLLMFYTKGLLMRWFFEDIPFYPFIVIALLNLTFTCLHTVHQSILRGMQIGKKLTAINIIVFVINMVFTLFFIGVLKLGAVGVLLSTLLINLLYVAYMLYDLKNNDLITICIDRGLLKEALRYSIPLLPHNLSTSIASFASRVFINVGASLSSVGLYSVAMQFGTIIDMIQSSVNNAFAPWFFEVMNKGTGVERRDIVILSRFLLILYSLIYMGIGLFSQEVIFLMTTDNYHMAWTVIPILVVAFSVKSVYYFYINILFYYKNVANKIFISTIMGSLADILLASILVKILGIYGAAVAFLVAKMIVVSVVIMMSRQHNDIGYKVVDMIKIIIPSLLFMGCGLFFSYNRYLTTFSWLNLLYKLGVLFAYLSFVYVTNRGYIKNMIKSRKPQRMILNMLKG